MSKYAVLAFFAISAIGCAEVQPPVRTPVVSHASRDEQICVASAPSLKEGDRVQFGRRINRPINAKTNLLAGSTELTARGQVVRVISEQCSVMRLPSDEAVHADDQIMSVSPGQTSTR